MPDMLLSYIVQVVMQRVKKTRSQIDRHHNAVGKVEEKLTAGNRRQQNNKSGRRTPTGAGRTCFGSAGECARRPTSPPQKGSAASVLWSSPGPGRESDWSMSRRTA
jgi:hypothetical protein